MRFAEGAFMNQLQKSTNQPATIGRLVLSLAACICLCLSGCTALNTGMQSKPIAADGGEMGTYTVEMHSNFGGVKGFKGTLNGNTTVSDALRDSEAIKKYRSMEIDVRRVVKKDGMGRGLVMPVRYETGSRSVPPEQDYALIDGDRIVIKPDSGTSVMKLLSTLTGG